MSLEYYNQEQAEKVLRDFADTADQPVYSEGEFEQIISPTFVQELFVTTLRLGYGANAHNPNDLLDEELNKYPRSTRPSVEVVSVFIKGIMGIGSGSFDNNEGGEIHFDVNQNSLTLTRFASGYDREERVEINVCTPDQNREYVATIDLENTTEFKPFVASNYINGMRAHVMTNNVQDIGIGSESGNVSRYYPGDPSKYQDFNPEASTVPDLSSIGDHQFVEEYPEIEAALIPVLDEFNQSRKLLQDNEIQQFPKDSLEKAQERALFLQVLKGMVKDIVEESEKRK